MGTPAAARAGTSPPALDPKIDRTLTARAADPDTRVEAVVVLHSPQEPVIESPRNARKKLTETTRPIQEPVIELVKSRGDEVVNTFWLKNMVLVRAKAGTLSAVADLGLVARIIPNFTVTSVPASSRAPANAGTEPTTWGIAKIGADRVWREHGLTGKGVRVAVLDTGIDITHPDLAGKMVSDDPADPRHPGGWIEFDASGRPVPGTPHDSGEHGTHVAGTVAGGGDSGTRIGVAPGAELMAGLVLNGSNGTLAQVVAGIQWAIAPYAADGTPAGRPADVVNMSLGANGYHDEFVEPVRNIHRAGAFPAIAIGNNCPPGGSAGPGNVYDSMSVGATDIEDGVPPSSCGGLVNRTDFYSAPAEWPETYVVPDLAAPGVDVVSAAPGGGYAALSGTSMATPHVAGTVALMREARPGLTLAKTEEILFGTAVARDLYGPRPNIRMGMGRVDAYAAVSEAALESGVRGVVVDERTREPLAGVKIAWSDARGTETDAQGRFEVRLPAGAHTLTLTRFGYREKAVNVQVEAGRLADVRLPLTPLPRGTISGRVGYGPSGAPVPGATVTVLDVPDALTATTDARGRYTIKNVPYGDHRVSAYAPGVSRSAPAPVGVAATTVTADLTLPRRPSTRRVSLGSDGRQFNNHAWWPQVSADGTVVVYGSSASNLTAEDNLAVDVFATDLRTGATEVVSVAADGGLADSDSVRPRVSADGRFVGFTSEATNLVAGDTNGQTDVFVRDRRTGSTERISVASGGAQANGPSGSPEFSADGRFAVFGSEASNLVPGDTNGNGDVFVYDRQTDTIERVSVASGGAQANGYSQDPSISADGRFVAFQSDAPDLVAGDTNGVNDVFVHDRRTGTVKRVTGPHPDGDTKAPALSADGRMVAFTHGVYYQDDVWVQDLATGTNTLVSVTTGGDGTGSATYGASISADGRFVAFQSSAPDLVEGDTNWSEDVFVRDVAAGTTTRASTGPEGADGLGRSSEASISGDGRYVAFKSAAANLVEGDTGWRDDVFLFDRANGPEPLFALAGLDVTPPVVHGGGNVHVRAWVTNVGERPGAYDAVVRVDGAEQARVSVPLRPGQAEQVTVKFRPEGAGRHTVTLGHLTGEFTVER